MSTQYNYDHYNVGQLRGMLRHFDREQMPERYERIQSEIERREAGGELDAKPVLPPEDESGYVFLFLASLFAVCVYGFILFAPLTFLSGVTGVNPLLVLLIGCIPGAIMLVLATIGVVVMRRVLRRTKHETVVKAWAIVAAALAPFSSFVFVFVVLESFIAVMVVDPSQTFQTRFNQWLCYIASFYVPFVLITLGLKFGGDNKSGP